MIQTVPPYLALMLLCAGIFPALERRFAWPFFKVVPPIVLTYLLVTGLAATGLWQVNGRNDVSYDSRVAFDRQYVENWSVLGDIRIILKTVVVVCLLKGSY